MREEREMVSRRQRNKHSEYLSHKARSSTAELYSKDIDVRRAGEAGLRNSGNSCYM